MPESFIQLPPNSTGLKAHTFQRTIGANVVEEEGVVLAEPYLAGYSVGGSGTAAAAGHVFQIMAGATLKVRIREIRVKLQAATAAGFVRLGLKRLTTAGTGGGVLVPNLLEPGDAACGATVMTNPTAAGTVAGEYMWTVPLPTTAAAPQPGMPGEAWQQLPNQKPLIIAAGVTNGFGMVIVTAVAGGVIDFMIRFDEANF